MELKERVTDFQIKKKISFDGKSYVTRLPTEVTGFLEEQGVSAKETNIEGIWKLKEKVFCIVMIFGDESETKQQNYFTDEPSDDDFVELKM
ncbi:MAG: hypothetical protein ACT4NJ_03560 [Nitrosopumilaceae archaeon]